MEIVFVWSWFSFIIGALSAIVLLLAVLFRLAFKQWKKGQKAKDDIGKMFDGWSGKAS